jgi:hypothetical protein
VRDLPPGKQPVTVEASDDDPETLRMDLVYTCPDGTSYPVAVAVPPIDADTGNGSATFESSFDPSFACADEGTGKVTALVTDGFERSSFDDPNASEHVISSSKSPIASIAAPETGQELARPSSLALSGSGRDPEDGELSGSALQWTLTAPGGSPVAVGSGSTVDVPAPTNGWTPGDYTVTLTTTDSDGHAVSTSTVVQVTGIFFSCSSMSGSNTFTPGLGHTKAAQTVVGMGAIAGCSNGQSGSLDFSGGGGLNPLTTYPPRPIGCPEALGGASGNDYADQTPILIGAEPSFRIFSWSSGAESVGIAKMKASAVNQVKIVFVITGGQYAGIAGTKTKLKGTIEFTPTDTYDCGTDADRIEATNFGNVGNVIVKRE